MLKSISAYVSLEPILVSCQQVFLFKFVLKNYITCLLFQLEAIFDNILLLINIQNLQFTVHEQINSSPQFASQIVRVRSMAFVMAKKNKLTRLFLQLFTTFLPVSDNPSPKKSIGYHDNFRREAPIGSQFSMKYVFTSKEGRFELFLNSSSEIFR